LDSRLFGTAEKETSPLFFKGADTRIGIDFNVKSIGPLNFYFEHRFTDIPG